MGFITNIISATVKTTLSPIALTKDVINVLVGEEPNTTKKLLNSAAKDAERAFNTAMGENDDSFL